MRSLSFVLSSAVLSLLLACQSDPQSPPQWSELQGVPAGFEDGVDNDRTDDEIRKAVVEKDPVFKASPASAISSENIAQWNTAQGWGDHAAAGYLKAESDPLFNLSPAASIT